MYIINKDKNSIEQVKEITFKDAGFKERAHLQEWIAKNPESLGEDLLIIQKEFAGFDDTNERLDLLALDKKGNLVVVENKLDDTGKDLVWQALKYASYCSSLRGQDIMDIFSDYLKKVGDERGAQKVLEDFFGKPDFEEKLNTGSTQRIIMVAGEFRKEVTSTVLWLLNYGLQLQCFKVTPYKLGEQVLLDFDQIIPIKEAEEYVIKVASKNREEIAHQAESASAESARYAFWTQFLTSINKQNNLLANVSPSESSWIPGALGMSGVQMNLVVSRSYARVEVFINTGNKTQNKALFDYFWSRKGDIEKDFGAPLIWERMDDRVCSRIKWQMDNVSVFEEEDYPKMTEFMIDGVVRMKKAFSGPVNDIP